MANELDDMDCCELSSNAELCICESGGAVNISNTQFSMVQSLLPDTFHHLICEFSLLSSNVLGDRIGQENHARNTFKNKVDDYLHTNVKNDYVDNQFAASNCSEPVFDSANGTLASLTQASSIVPVASPNHESDMVRSSECVFTTFDSTHAEVVPRTDYLSNNCMENTDAMNNMCAFKAKLRVNVNSMEELDLWRQEFGDRSKTTMRLANTGVCTGRRTLFKTRLRCQHNTMPRSLKADTRKSSKNTRCPAAIVLTLKRSDFTCKGRGEQVWIRRCQSHDVHLPEYPLAVTIEFNHNHLLDCTSVLRRRDVSPEMETKFIEMMRVGHHPVAALSLHKYDLYLKHGANDCTPFINDRYYCPDLAWCYRIFYKLFKKKFRQTFMADFDIEKIRECVECCRRQLASSISENFASSGSTDVNVALTPPSVNGHVIGGPDGSTELLYSVDPSESFIAMDVIDGTEVAIAICTPLMKRVHRLVQQSAEIVFVDVSPAISKRRRCRTVVLTTKSCAGSLPLGVLVATSDTAIRRTLELYVGLLDSRCFFGRGGSAGPLLFVLDDCFAVYQALISEFNASTFLLSTHHILVGFWRLLWDRKSTVALEHRSRAFDMLRSAMLATDCDRSAVGFEEARTDSSVLSCPTALAYVTKIQERLLEWAVFCHSRDWPPSPIIQGLGGIRGLCSCASLCLKDAVIHRLKSMETVSTVLDFAGPRIDAYFERRLTDLVSERVDDAATLRFMPEDVSSGDVVVRNSRYFFTVACSTPASRDAHVLHASSVMNCIDGRSGEAPSSAAGAPKEFYVEMSVGLCSCEIGSTSAPCRHQWSVVQQFALRNWQFVPIVGPPAKRLLNHVGTGRGLAERSWFALSHPLQSVVTAAESDIDYDEIDGDCVDNDKTVLSAITEVQLAASSNDPTLIDAGLVGLTMPSINNKPVVINWNGTSYELKVNVPSQPEPTSASSVVLPMPVVEPSTASHDRLRLALKKIEDSYLAHPVAMETAIDKFCQSVEDVDTVEMLNASLLCFSNTGYLTADSGAANGPMTYGWS